MISFCGKAQNGSSLLLKILNTQKAPVPNATVELLRSTDSLLLKVALSDSTGTVQFHNLTSNHYRLRISSSGYAVHRVPGSDHAAIMATLAVPAG